MARRLIASQLRRLVHDVTAGPTAKPFSALKNNPFFSQNHIFSCQLKQNRNFSFSTYKPLGLLFLAQAKNGVEIGKILTRGARSLSFSLQRRSGPSQLISSLRRYWSYYFMRPDTMVLSLIGANVAVFILWGIADPSFMKKNFMVSLDNLKSGRIHTLITNAFSHSDGNHLLSNMLGLYFFGQGISNLFGPNFLLKLYFAGALTGSVFYLVHRAYLASSNRDYIGWDQSRLPSHGASAAVNAIILLEVFLFPKRLVYFYFLIPVPAALFGALIIGADLWRVRDGQGRVSGEAHLGGALVAMLVWARVRKRWI